VVDRVASRGRRPEARTPRRPPARQPRCRASPSSAGPNVGKSTLVNRILGRRVTIVEEKPGVTRDRTEHLAEWLGPPFVVVDTGGWEHAPRA
jgi:hypothetical protein